MIKIINLSIKCENFFIFKNINFLINKNKIYVIIGNNGIGKSTLLKSFIKDENYVFSGKIIFNKINILNYKTDYISRLGIFFSFQNSIEIYNIKNIFFLKTCYDIFNLNNIYFFKLLKFYKKKINFKKKLFFRSYNYGFSGGEKKKNDFLFLIIINPCFILLDEIDSGLDYLSVLFIINYLNLIKKNKFIILITHNKNIGKMLKIDYYILINKNKINFLSCIKHI
ncbi:ATP-binding cassette domain-containing protein [Candidatus Carsonella ruddii]|uniref:Iron-sulfur cluster assembly ATPase protein SufC n=1 Tax=Carsonella ruddii TaxID=114186 RepID=A0A1U9RRE3_CARRU|nr:ATP-binding cassette domain-containing protein [Candidatus Carsonella ruddii]AQU89456.1 Iron-sulfur cluster assembly ATPase protein SufC [Candidatus Carsonella ruddii]